MSKAYDRVERDFIWHPMIGFGFDDGFIGLVSRCISTVNFWILNSI